MKKIENKAVIGDCLDLLSHIPDEIFPLVINDQPYNKGKKIANDNLKKEKFLKLFELWTKTIVPKLTPDGSYYFFINEDYLFDVKPIVDKYLIFRKLIIWFYEGFWGKFTKNYDNRAEYILFYTKSDTYTFNEIREPASDSTIERWKTKAELDGTVLYQNLPPYDQKRFKKENYERSPRNIYRGPYQGNVFVVPKCVRGNNPEFKFGRHPTQKPLALLERIIEISSTEDDLIGDFFCGSGTTLVAAKKLRCKYFGCETRTDFLEIAKNRLNSVNVYKNILNFTKPKEKNLMNYLEG